MKLAVLALGGALAAGVASAACSVPAADPAIGGVSFRVWEMTATAVRTNLVCQETFAREGRDFARFGERKAWGFRRGVRPAKPVSVSSANAYDLTFEGRVPNLGCTYVVYLVMLDADGQNVSATVPAPDKWNYSPYSKAFYRNVITLMRPDAWETVTLPFAVPDGVAAVVPEVAAWRGEWTDCRRLTVLERRALERHELNLTRTAPAADGSLVFVAEADGIGLTVRERREPSGATLYEATVADLAQPPRPRALRVEMAWLRDLAGWTWHRDWRTDEAIGAKSSFFDCVGVGGHVVSRYPFDAVSKDGVGIALGMRFGDPVFESRTVSAKGIASSVPVGLLERGGKGTSATYTWLVLPFRGTWGFRSAARAYYAAQADRIPSPKLDDREGTWLWPIHATKIPERPGDFGLTFWEAPSTVARLPKEIAAARAKGIGVFPYTEAWGMRQNLPTLPDGGHPPVADRLRELQGWAAETGTKARWFDAPRNVAAQAALNSLPVQPDGTHPFAVDKYDRWSHWWRTNADPRLGRPNRASLCWDYTVGLDVGAIDGLYLDSVSYGFAVDFNNVRPEHLAVMDEPLVYDTETARPCANGLQHQVAFVSWVAARMHPLGKRVFGNVFDIAHRFHASTIDVFGSEVGCWGNGGAKRAEKLHEVLSDASACERRFYARHRPVADLLQEGNFTTPATELSAAGVTNYFAHHVFYAFYPGVCTIGGEEKPGYAGWKRYFGAARQCERDRELFRRTIPVIRRLNRAGWEPETLVRSSKARVLVERYGEPSRGDCLLTVRNASKEPLTAEFSAEAELRAAVTALKPVWGGTAEPKVADGRWTLSLAPWQTVVLKAH